MFWPMYFIALVAGALVGYVAISELKERFNYRAATMSIMLFIFLILAITISAGIHMHERARMNSDTTRSVGVYFCFLEDVTTCQSKVNVINNENYTKYQNGQTTVFSAYLPVALTNIAYTNFVTYFIAGAMSAIFFIYRKD